MKKVLLIYSPFCTPATPSYSLTYLTSFLRNNSKHKIKVIDLNLDFHDIKFPKFKKYFKNPKKWDDYSEKVKEFKKQTKEIYSKNHTKIINNQKPEFYDLFLEKIKKEKPDIICFSLVYSSQCFYTSKLLKDLKEYTTIIGGPAVNEKIKKLADQSLNNEIELLEHIEEKRIKNIKYPFPLDFSIWKLKDYFSPKPIIPLKTCSNCYYQKCTFCTHHNNSKYFEYDLKNIEKTIIQSKQKHFFLIDDMIHKKRLLDLSKIFKRLKVNWTCQLKPTQELEFKTLKKLRESGLTMIMWGIESGNQRILNLIKKGTNVKDIEKVLKYSSKAGIKNIAYMIFGFPTETKEEFLETIEFLKRNQDNIDLISNSIFGLQKGTPIYKNPKKYFISNVQEIKRTVLDPQIKYKQEKGLTKKQATKLLDNHKRTIEKINKFPKEMNFFREHMFSLLK